MHRGLVVALALAATSVAPRDADAYEFWLRAQTIGQAYELSKYQLVGPDLFLGRRRYTQTLALRIVDIGDLAAARRRARRARDGVRVSWHSYLRIDHDFGQYSMGRIEVSQNTRRDALDVIPELSESIASLDLMYGYLQVDDLGERVDLQLGRLLVDDGWGTSGLDGARAAIALPAPVELTVAAGLRVRASSFAGIPAYELDGTSGAGCREYVEGETPGTGTWQLIDRDRQVANRRLSSDFEYCPQREVRQPTVGAALATSRIRSWGAEAGYRRTWSRTVGLIGDVDRLDTPDLGLYPDEAGQAPASGINEERLYARVHGRWTRRGVAIAPFANARYSLVHAALDRADAGVRLGRGKHLVEPTLEYFLPTFDSDSIFNAFSIEPTADARVRYAYDGVVRAHGSAWLRRYLDAEDAPWSGGVDADVAQQLTPRLQGRAGALYDDGYGGRRVGATLEGAFRARRDIWLRGRAIVLGVAPETSAARDRRFVTTSIVASSTWRLADAAALHTVLETNHDAIHATQLRANAVLDLAFAPEP